MNSNSINAQQQPTQKAPCDSPCETPVGHERLINEAQAKAKAASEALKAAQS